MIFDGHIHITSDKVESRKLMDELGKVGIGGGILLSIPPENYITHLPQYKKNKFTNLMRLKNLMEWVKGYTNLYPFYWIDPMEDDALDQVKQANYYGICGFKVICNRFYPGDSRVLQVFNLIAKLNKPILFHSGILWDGSASSKYNRPVEFEALLEIEGLRFALAHVSWPWHDECIAVYGKFLNIGRANPRLGIEMFLDLTPGTPRIYREELLRKLFNVGYDVKNNVFFGTDCEANCYNTKISKDYIDTDEQIMNRLFINEEVKENVFCKNLERFVLGKG